MWLAALALAACFGQPQDVVIEGYRDHAMEPFIARDGETLFFNNRNEPARETDLHWATRVNDLRFRYRGRIPNANSGELDGVPSLARDGTFASPRCAPSKRAARRSGPVAGTKIRSPVSILRLRCGPGRRRTSTWMANSQPVATGSTSPTIGGR
jgi:hypothetical protein